MAGFTVTRRGLADGRGERSGQLAANSVNTGKLLLSATGKDPTLTTDFHSAFTFPNYTALSTQDDYAVSPGSTLPDGTTAVAAKTIYQLASGVYNTGTQNTVALAGFARGQNVWGQNTVTMADGTSAIGIADEKDFGVQQAGSQCDGLGLHLHFGTGAAAGNPGHALVITSRGSGIPDIATGVCALVSTTTLTTSGGAQTPDTGGNVLNVASGATAAAAASNQLVYGGTRWKVTANSDTQFATTFLEGTASLTIPNGAKVYAGNQPFPTVNGSFISASGFVQAQTGIDFSHLLATYAGSWLAVNTSAGANGIVLEPRQGVAASGVGLHFVTDSTASGATMQYGVRFDTGAVDATGTLVLVASGSYTKGLSLAGGAFSDSAIDLGDNNVRVGTTTGAKIGTATTQKLGFFNRTPVVQPTAAANTHTVAAGATTNVFTNTTFDGSTGSTAYTVGDLVAALKNLGLIAA